MTNKCGIILYNTSKKKFCLVYGKKSKKWGFPKGHMEYGETEETTALREFYEETGHYLSPQINLGKNKFIVKNNIYFIVTINKDNDLIRGCETIPDTNEIEKYEWMSIDNILNMEIQQCNFGLKTWILNKKYNEIF